MTGQTACRLERGLVEQSGDRSSLTDADAGFTKQFIATRRRSRLEVDAPAADISDW